MDGMKEASGTLECLCKITFVGADKVHRFHLIVKGTHDQNRVGSAFSVIQRKGEHTRRGQFITDVLAQL